MKVYGSMRVRGGKVTPSSLVIIRLQLLLLDILVAVFTSVNAFTSQHRLHGHNLICTSSFPLPTHKSTSTTILFNYQNDREEGGDTTNNNIDNPSSSTSIGDVVQNLHGGKYQFSETQYIAGGSLVGQQFAESLYSGSVDESLDTSLGTDDNNEEELPKWAQRMQDPSEQNAKPALDTIAFDVENAAHTISIKNDERSWERYYAFILPNHHADGLFRISPTTGSLAPRGGASNVCDESKPYLDSANISIEWIGGEGGSTGGIGGGGNDELLLVVGTEAEVWRYRLQIQ